MVDEQPEAGERPVSRWRRIGRIALRVTGALGLLLTIAAIALRIAAGPSLGAAAEGERLARMIESPNFDDGKFQNPEPLWNDYVGMIIGTGDASDHQLPVDDIPVERVTGDRFDTPPASGLRATWLGHSTVLLEIDGHRILTDPIWGPRSSPWTWLGPERWYPPPLDIGDLPELDAIVISHDHYDHLDYPTVELLRDHDVPWLVPLGVGAHLAHWGVPAELIVEMDWGDVYTIRPPGMAPASATSASAAAAPLAIHATEARHASGRTPWTMDETLWVGFAFVGAEHRAFFSGDTGLFNRMRDIGARLGPFDLTMIEVGAYDRTWPDWHIGPEQAVEAHEWLRGDVLLPIHWGMFDLANHGWTEPIERTIAAAQAAGVTIVSPPPGGSVEPTVRSMGDRVGPIDGPATGAPAGPLPRRWWPSIPWATAAERPIVSTGIDGRR